MYSTTDPPARRSRTFDVAATMSMEALLRTAQRIPTYDRRRSDVEIALRVECCMPNRNIPTSDMERDWDDGWLYGIALAARTMNNRQHEVAMLRVTDARPRGRVHGW